MRPSDVPCAAEPLALDDTERVVRVGGRLLAVHARVYTDSQPGGDWQWKSGSLTVRVAAADGGPLPPGLRADAFEVWCERRLYRGTLAVRAALNGAPVERLQAYASAPAYRWYEGRFRIVVRMRDAVGDVQSVALRPAVPAWGAP